ncbi:MAG: sensor histidine kinase, partial [Acidimicrobiales bacterium]
LATRPGRSTNELARAVREAAQETDVLIRLAEDLLLLSRGDEGTSLARPERQDLVSVVGAHLSSFDTRARDGGVELRLDAPEALIAPFDALRVRQIAGNLLDNALSVAPAGSAVEVRLYEGNGGAVLEVADRGPGFPSWFLPRAFDRFSRADGARDRGNGRVGLGLAIVKALAEDHGGRAEAANRPDGGALVRVVFPHSPT